MAKKNALNEDLVQDEQVVPTFEENVVEAVAQPWDGHTTRAYRSFEVPYGVPLKAETPAVDGGQEEA